MAGGRPRTTIDDLPNGWRDIVLAIAAEGASDVEIRHKVGIGKSAWATLLEDSEEFRDTINEARELCAVWWEKSGRKLAVDGGGNSAIWIFNMKNRFGWRDKKEEEDKKDDMGDIIRDLIAKLPG
ncbi:MAG: hypothetical protein [Caudoviricetes sp.]|nr:MAG: hypothetical protein [Caudoviricetes sp.]